MPVRDALLVVGLAACGARSVQPASDGGPAGTDGEALAGFGEDCTEDADCESGICWDYGERDASCGGKVCSVLCTTSKACEGLAASAGAASAAGAECGVDDQCDLVGTGLGAFVCE